MGSQIRIWWSLPTSMLFSVFWQRIAYIIQTYFAIFIFCAIVFLPAHRSSTEMERVTTLTRYRNHFKTAWLEFVFGGFYSQPWLACCSQYWTCDRNRWTFENKLFRDMVLDKKVCHSCKSVDFWIGEIGGAPMLQRLKHHLVQSCATLQHTDSFTRLSLMLHNPRTLQLSYSPPRKLLIMWIQFFHIVESLGTLLPATCVSVVPQLVSLNHSPEF